MPDDEQQQNNTAEPSAERALWDDAHPEDQLDRLRAATLVIAGALKNQANVQEAVDILA